MFRHLFLGFLICPLICPWACEAQEKWHTRVSLTVEGSGELRPVVDSYVRREFRKLGDVNLVDGDSAFRVQIVTSQLKTGTTITGWAISTVVLSNAVWLESWIKPEHVKLMTAFLKDTRVLEQHYLWVGPKDDLERECATLVATIDSEVFEARRREWQKYLDSKK